MTFFAEIKSLYFLFRVAGAKIDMSDHHTKYWWDTAADEFGTLQLPPRKDLWRAGFYYNVSSLKSDSVLQEMIN